MGKASDSRSLEAAQPGGRRQRGGAQVGRGEEGIFSMSGLSTTTEDLVGGRAGGRGRVGGGGGQGQG